MLSISSSQPVGWSTAPPMQAAAPVQAVPAVGAAKPSPRDGQSDPGRSGQGSRGGASATAPRAVNESATGAPAAQAAPILPRERKDGERSSPADEAAEAKVQAEQRQIEEQKALDKAEQQLKLQEVLATVWKASAAVVDVALGREAAQAGAAEQAELPGIEPLPAALRREQEPVAYNEQGASSLAPLEAGSLISHRV